MQAEDFEDELTCPVCLMLFTDPRTLPSVHFIFSPCSLYICYGLFGCAD